MVANVPGEIALAGLHDAVGSVLLRFRPPGRALDVATGKGGIAARLIDRGFETDCADLHATNFELDHELHEIDLDGDWPTLLPGPYDVVTAVEIIEHLENPIGFLRNVRRVLSPTGHAVVTTPNVDNLPSRVKFLVRGTLRSMDEWGDPTHISPIHWDLLHRQYLTRAGLTLAHYERYPAAGFQTGNPRFRSLLNLLGRAVSKPPWGGDIHIFVLRRDDAQKA